MKSLILFSLIFCTINVFAEVVVVVSAQSKIASASAGDLKKLFLGKSTTLGGVPASPCMHKDSSSSHITFADKITGKSQEALSKHWTKLIFTGKAQSPNFVIGDKAVISFVTSKEGGVGYIDSSSLNATVKAIYTIK